MPKVADYIEQHRDALVERFVEEASKLPSALGAKRNEVIDTFYEYLSTLAAISRQGERGGPARTKSRLEETHIGLRLRMGYSQEEVTSEYVLMGRLITQLWEGLPSAEQPTAEDVQLLFEELASAMDTVVSTYTGYSVEDRQREKRTLRRLDALAAGMLEEGGALGPHLPPLLDVIQEAMGAEGVDLFLLDEEGRRLVLVASGGRFAGAAEASSVEVDGTAFAAVAGRSEEPVVLPHVADATTAVREAVRGSGLQSLLGLRLWPQGRLTGVLYVGVVEARPFSPRARRSFETLVEYLSGIIDRARLLERVRKERAQALEAVEALRRSEEEWRLFVQSIEDYATIYRVDAEGRVASWNAGAERFEGYRAEEVMGRPLSLLFYPEAARARGEPEADLRQAAAEGRLSVEGWRVRGKQPSPFWAEMVLIAHRDEAGVLRGFTKITRDLTERHRAREARREQEEEARFIAEANPQVPWTAAPDGAITGFSDRWLALTGMTREETFGGGWLKAPHPEDLPRIREAWEHAVRTGTPYDIEHRIRLAGGGFRWMRVRAVPRKDARGQVVRWYGTTEDIEERKRAEEALRASEERLRLVVDNLPVLINFVDTQQRYVLNNRAYRTWFGLEPEALRGRTVREVVGEENYRDLEPLLTRALAGELVEAQLPFVFRDGRRGFIICTFVPYRDPEGHLRGYVTLVQDITERRQLEAALEASEARLRRTLGATGAGTFELDVTPDVMRFDARMWALVGRATDSPLSLSGSQAFIHPEDRAEVSRLVREALTPGGPSSLVYEHRVVTPEGGERWLSVRAGVERGGDGQPLRLVGTAVDVTEQKRTQQQLELVFQRSPDMMGMASPEGRFVRVNPAFVRILGWSPEQLATMPFLDLVHPGDVERTQAEFDKLLSGQPTLRFENRYRRVDGDYRWLAWAAAPLPDSSLVFCTGRDVTEERSQVDFEQKLIGIVGHDLRQPLQVIAMSATLLLKRQTLEERSLSVVHRILGGAERASRMLRDILDFTQARLSGGIPLNLAEGDVVQVVQEAAEEVEAAHPGWRVELLVEGDGRGQWDADRLRQVLDNLLSNALTYGSPGVPVRVEVDGRAGDEVVLRVHNEGRPIAPELLPVLFDAMTRGDTQGGQRRSVGLGLFIVRHVVEAHGGRVSVQSEEGAGTTFTVRLPRRSS